MVKISQRALALGLTLMMAVPALAQPVENGTEVAQLLEALGDRCWAVDIDGSVIDAAALSEINGPIDIELECVISELKAAPKQAVAKDYI